jgi:prephenate dehydrogenase
LAIGFVFNAKPNLRRPVVASIVGLGAVGILVAGIISIANGTRTIEPHHGDDHGEEHSDEETEESLPSDAATLELVVVAQ